MSNRLSLLLGIIGVAALLSAVWETGSRRRHAGLPAPLEIRPAAATRVRTLPLSPPSPTASPSTSTQIRVGLTASPQSTLAIDVNGPFRIQPVGSARVLHRGTSLAAATVAATPRGLRVGKIDLPVSRIEIMPESSPGIWVAGHQYRGVVRFYRQAGSAVVAVNVLPLDDYVASVVDSEMPAEFGVEARAAQAIVARTFALYQMQAASQESIVDLYASTRSQKYLGYQYRSGGRLLAGESPESRRIAAETQRMVCVQKGKLFCTYYCAACGGATLLGTDFFPDAAPPLQSVPCNYCQPARLYRWTAEISRGELESDLRKFAADERPGASFRTLKSIRQIGKPVPGRMAQFEVRSDRPSFRVSGAELRVACGTRGLNSPTFTIEDRGQSFLISGSGHGHGVGLCQWGARGLAREGKNRLQILNYYYPGSRIVVVDLP